MVELAPGPSCDHGAVDVGEHVVLHVFRSHSRDHGVVADRHHERGAVDKYEGVARALAGGAATPSSSLCMVAPSSSMPRRCTRSRACLENCSGCAPPASRSSSAKDWPAPAARRGGASARPRAAGRGAADGAGRDQRRVVLDRRSLHFRDRASARCRRCLRRSRVVPDGARLDARRPCPCRGRRPALRSRRCARSADTAPESSLALARFVVCSTCVNCASSLTNSFVFAGLSGSWACSWAIISFRKSFWPEHRRSGW